MSDVIDTANQAAEFMHDIDLANELARHQLPPQRIVDEGVLCMDCDGLIDPDRLAARPDCVRCISCQIVIEKDAKRWS